MAGMKQPNDHAEPTKSRTLKNKKTTYVQLSNHSLVRRFNDVSMLKSQQCVNVNITTSVQISNPTVSMTLVQCCYNVVVPTGLAVGRMHAVLVLDWQR